MGAFENRRSFTSIVNLTYLINQIIEKDIDSGIYLVADDEVLSTNEIIRLIAASQGRKSSSRKIELRNKPLITLFKQYKQEIPFANKS